MTTTVPGAETQTEGLISARPDGWEPWYLTGLIEALGTFTFSRSGRNISVYLAVKLPECDRGLLERLRDELGGVGRIYAVRGRAIPSASLNPLCPESAATSAAHITPDSSTLEPIRQAGSCYFRICRQAELLSVVDHLDRYPMQGRKRSSFEIWKQMVLLKGSYRRPAREELQALAGRLSVRRPRRGADTRRLAGQDESAADMAAASAVTAQDK